MLRSEIKNTIMEMLQDIEDLDVKFIPTDRPNINNTKLPLANLFYKSDKIEGSPNQNANSKIESELVFKLQVIAISVESLEENVEKIEKAIILEDGKLTYDGVEFQSLLEGQQTLYEATLNISQKYDREYYHEGEYGTAQLGDITWK